MLRHRGPGVGLALRTGAPVAIAAAARDGSVVVRWANGAMGELLGLGPDDGAGTRLADVLDRSSARLTAAVRDLIGSGAEDLTVQVGVGAGAPREVVLHLVLPPPTAADRLLALVRPGRSRSGVLHARLAESPVSGGGPEDADGHGRLLDRLGTALLRLRRTSSRVVLAMVSIISPEDAEDGPTAQPLADRVRSAARDTDTVVEMGAGRLAVLAEDPLPGGELAMARRVLGVVRRSSTGAHVPLVRVTVMEVVDPDADPEELIAHLDAAAAGTAEAGGLTVLDPWTVERPAAGGAAGTGQEHESAERSARALESGRFHLGLRPVRALAGPDPSTVGLPGPSPGPESPVTLVEVGTHDAGVLTPVQVTAPGLATALDRWALSAAAALDVHDVRLVVRLQPGGPLTPALGDEVAVLLGRRPDLGLVVQVPEERLAEAIAAERAVLGQLPLLGVRLGVHAWSGAIDVRTLVRCQVQVVELSQACVHEVVRPEGAALVTGLVAGLRAGLGPDALVVADEPRSAAVREALVGCGVSWSVSPPA